MRNNRGTPKLYTTKKVSEVLIKNGKLTETNPSLLLTKHAIYNNDNQKFSISDLHNFLFRGLSINVDLYKSHFKNLKNIGEIGGFKIMRFYMWTKSRLVVGLGDESVYEVSLRLNRNYGVPVIPGSALKGIAKDYARIFLNWNEDKIKRIFGDAEKGKVMFLDAYPAPDDIIKDGKLQLDLDIMNPHYNHYYQNNEPPGDWGNPVPIFFLTVKPGIKFLFGIGAGRGINIEEIKDLLKKALMEYGVGAKTSLGYGLFEEVN